MVTLSVQCLCQFQNLIEPRRRRKRKADFRRFERSKPMELWQADIMGGVVLASGRVLKVITGLDDHSRFCVIAKLLERATARPVCAAFTDALDRYGIPDEILTDNGKVFTARFARRGGETLFDNICRAHGIHHILTGVRAPTTIGKVERFHETLRRDFFSKHISRRSSWHRRLSTPSSATTTTVGPISLWGCLARWPVSGSAPRPRSSSQTLLRHP
jgi:transposase InsO family protein